MMMMIRRVTKRCVWSPSEARAFPWDDEGWTIFTIPIHFTSGVRSHQVSKIHWASTCSAWADGAVSLLQHFQPRVPWGSQQEIHWHHGMLIAASISINASRFQRWQHEPTCTNVLNVFVRGNSASFLGCWLRTLKVQTQDCQPNRNSTQRMSGKVHRKPITNSRNYLKQNRREETCRNMKKLRLHST
jgi:hypothetical protein